MGKQYNKAIKRRRRHRYLERLKERRKESTATAKNTATEETPDKG